MLWESSLLSSKNNCFLKLISRIINPWQTGVKKTKGFPSPLKQNTLYSSLLPLIIPKEKAWVVIPTQGQQRNVGKWEAYLFGGAAETFAETGRNWREKAVERSIIFNTYVIDALEFYFSPTQFSHHAQLTRDHYLFLLFLNKYSWSTVLRYPRKGRACSCHPHYVKEEVYAQ